MGESWVVAPEIVRLPLSDGHYLDVQKELNAGQYLEMLSAMADRKPFAKALAYLVGWSICGVDGQPVAYDFEDPEEVRRSTLKSLKVPRMREITVALDRHEAAEQAALEAKKKTPSLELASSQP
jgi:hypothetical protein